MAGDGVKQKRQLFPDKLWDLVNNQHSSGIHWSRNGKRIEIDRAQLEKFLQTRLLDRNTYPNSPSASSTKFRSHNFDSFIRQLHFYGFKKAGNSYYHEKFQRDRPDFLSTMKRKYSTLPQLSGNSQTLQTMLPQTSCLTRQLSQASMSSQSPTSTHKKEISGVDTDQMTLSATASSASSSSSSLSSSSQLMSAPSPKKRRSSARHPDTIKMYTIDSSGGEGGILSFSNVREASVRAVRDQKSVKISIPDLMLNNHSNDSWPKTLVLENQNILSAYFIYKLN